MSTLTFDTHAFIKRLIAAGMPEAQAEAVTTMAHEVREADLSQLVTKDYLSNELEKMELRMTIKLGGMLVVFAGVLLAAIRYLPAH